MGFDMKVEIFLAGYPEYQSFLRSFYTVEECRMKRQINFVEAKFEALKGSLVYHLQNLLHDKLYQNKFLKGSQYELEQLKEDSAEYKRLKKITESRRKI